MRAILVHGMGRSPISMFLLGSRSRKAGFRPFYFAYSVTFEQYGPIAERLTARLATLITQPCVAIGHSLGGLLLRDALSRLQPTVEQVPHVFLLGTPNRSPRLARVLKRRLPYRMLMGDCGQLLADPVRIDSIPKPSLPTTIIAGTRGWHSWKSPFGSEPNDGIVALSESNLEGANTISLPLPHTFLMNGRQVFEIIQRSL